MREIATAIVACLVVYGCMETNKNPDCGPFEHLGYRSGCNQTEPVCLPHNYCGEEPTAVFCGCDGTEFLSRCSKPDRPYAYPGPCVEGIGDDTPPCGTDGECGPDEMCAFAPGCEDPERYCVVDTCADLISIWYCSCTGETFDLGCVASDRPIISTGMCDDSSTDGDAPDDPLVESAVDVPGA